MSKALSVNDEALTVDEEDLDQAFTSAGFTRGCTEETEFSEVGWSRTCTEDVCPNLPDKFPLKFSPPSQPRWIELILESNPSNTRTVLTDLTEVVGDLRTVISEATGVERGCVKLIMYKTDHLLPDHELIPSPVMVRGVNLFPKGGMLLGRVQFMQSLLDVKDIIDEARSQGRLCPFSGGTKDFRTSLDEERRQVKELIIQHQKHKASHSCVQTIFEGVDDRKASFKDVTALISFYHTSSFKEDAEIQEIYNEVKVSLGSHRGWLLDLIEEEEDAILIGG